MSVTQIAVFAFEGVSLCLGAFVLGEAGLLNGKEATTHWAARDLFAQRFPQAIFRPDVLYVSDDNNRCF